MAREWGFFSEVSVCGGRSPRKRASKDFRKLATAMSSRLKVILWCDGSSDRSFITDSLSYFIFQPVFSSGGYNKGCGM